MMVAVVSGQAPQPTLPAAAGPTSHPSARALLDRYCVACHNQRLKTANLLLDELDVTHLTGHAEIGERMVRKLRAGMMPPQGMPRPDAPTLEALITWLEHELDRGAVPNIESPGLHRLNRVEYQNAIRDLLGLEIDATKFLPSDNSTHGFDNNAGALTMSPALMEAYLSAAAKISQLALGRATAPREVVYPVPSDATQNYHVEGLPFATRGGILINHEFPADGEYAFKITPVAEGNMGQLNDPFGRVKGEQLELLVDGALVTLFDWDKEMQGFAVRFGLESPRVHLTAGSHAVGVTFVATQYAPGNDLNQHFSRTTIDTGPIPGYTFYPHVGIVRVMGPFDAKAATDSPSRRKVLVCRPTNQQNEARCAREILATLGRRAFRRPVTAADVGRLMAFYDDSGRRQGTFEDGIEAALERLLIDPEFIYRGEAGPAAVRIGQSYPLSDLALASRLSFFLWSSIPDDVLLQVAAQGRLRQPAELERQVRRMLADPKAEALVENFTGQWLNLRGLSTVSPDPNVYPDFDDNLRQAFRREVELFFDSIVREDRSITDLLTADYTFADERLARHYGIPRVRGSQFRRVTLGPDFDMRRGLLGKGALMAITSQATRTSPVTRGKWFLQTFLGVSPPDPPPNVPAVKAAPPDPTGNAKEPTMRERMEQHHTNPVCSTCHRIFEPIGLALENFDAIGAWRVNDGGTLIDASGMLTDGTRIDGVASVRDMLTRYADQFERVFAERMLTYALGRGVEYRDMPLVRSLVRDAAAHDYRFSSFVLGIVKSASFQQNLKEAVPQRVAR
jgi:hypothetical protein